MTTPLPVAATVTAMPQQPLEPDAWSALNQSARDDAAAHELEPMSTKDIAAWFKVTPETVRRQWIHERAAIRDPHLRFPEPTWPDNNPRWAWRVIRAWGVHTGRLNDDGTPKEKTR